MSEGTPRWKKWAAAGATVVGALTGVLAAQGHHSPAPEVSQSSETQTGIPAVVDSTVTAVASAVDTLRYADNPHTKVTENGNLTAVTTILPGPNGSKRVIEAVSENDGGSQGTFNNKGVVYVDVTGVQVTGEGNGQVTRITSDRLYNSDTDGGRRYARNAKITIGGKTFTDRYQQIVSGEGWQGIQTTLTEIAGTRTPPVIRGYNTTSTLFA